MNDLTINSLDNIAIKANKGLVMVKAGEEDTIKGWLIYGAALNEGRKQFPKGDNKRFSDWAATANLAGVKVVEHERTAAMWAAKFPEDFEATRKAFPNVRTVRGLHAKFNNPTPATPKLKATEADIQTMKRLKALADGGATAGERQAAQTKLDKMKDYIEVDAKALEPVKEKTLPVSLEGLRHTIAEELLTEMALEDAKQQVLVLLRLAYGKETSGLVRRLQQIREKI